MQISTRALIDTGAPLTVFPRGIADALALDVPRTWEPGLKKIRLLGREWSAFSTTVELQLDVFADMAWTAEVNFVLDEGLRFGLLGYEGFLNRWAVSFDGYHSFFVVEPVETFVKRVEEQAKEQKKQEGIDPFEEFQRRWPDSYNP